MKAALLIILLASTYLLHAEAVIPSVPTDVKKLAGTWYPISFVLRNEKPVEIKIFDDTVVPFGKDYIVKLRHIEDQTCRTLQYDLVHTETPGQYKIPATGELVHIVEVDYGSHHFAHGSVNGGSSMYLLSRTRNPPDNVKAKFKTIVESLGYDVNKITYIKLEGKSKSGGMSEKLTTSILVLHVTLAAVCHIF